MSTTDIRTTPPKALLFDVFGTVVDWRSTITNTLISHCTTALSAADTSLPSAVRLHASTLTPQDWGTFAQQWRNSYKHFTQTHDPSKPFITIDEHHYTSLKTLLHTWSLTSLFPDAEVHEISLLWHHLNPWPDSSPGISALNQKFTTCTLSNGNVSLLTDMAAYASLPWTHIFSSEHFSAYKPSPLVYNGAAEKLGLQTGQCALVAAHLGDLKAARGCGYRTVYVEREEEEDWGVEEVEKARREGWIDLWVGLGEGGFLEVARRFGIQGEGGSDGGVERGTQQ
ncbi:MAG: hypothetical protein M1830_001136 [Pleopsidium flavum]|nr:MAG: hypothetical protein M1830_001136 [Pleopsidium flavum]